MSTNLRTDGFFGRFDRIVRDYKTMGVLRGACWVLFAALMAFSAIAALDYVFEIQQAARTWATTVLLFAAAVAAVVVAVRAIWLATDEQVAGRMEARFPQLGQSVRTSVQYRGAVAPAGLSPTLVAQMHQKLGTLSENLPLRSTLPHRELRFAAILLGVCAIAMAVLVAGHWDWRTAVMRTLFIAKPYTQVAVSPGDTMVDEGSTLTVIAAVSGRVNRPTAILSRVPGGEEPGWTRRELSPDEITRNEPRHVEYEIELPKMQQSLEYRVASGPYLSTTHHVAVRHPLEIESIEIEIHPPAYTGMPTTVVDSANFVGAAGSRARFQIVLDRPAETASISVSPLNRGDTPDDAQDRTIPLTVDGVNLTGEIKLAQDMLYSIEGLAADGSRVRKNRHRVGVRQDRPPRVAFQYPPFETEVHSLAELFMRARADDDYGLLRAGVVFQINNGPEYTLLLQEFEDRPEGPDAPTSADGAAPPKTVSLEKVLPLEHFDLTQKDSVTYYAFAEDNAPGGPRRVLTDLQFIDIRPFRRLYRPMEGGRGGGGGGGPQLASLEELISRQRFILNRTMRLGRTALNGGRVNLDDVDQIVRLQQTVAELTGELADAVAQFEDETGITEDRVSDLFFSAEEAMLSTMDSLSVGDYDTAALQEQDAVRYLVEARNAVEVIIGQGGGGALQRLFRANRRLLQKLRRPQSELDKAAEAARMLRGLADREAGVNEALMDMTGQTSAADAVDDPWQLADPALRQEIQNTQLDIELDAEQVDRTLQQIEGLTPLALERSTQSVEAAATVTGALVRGATEEAALGAQTAGEQFMELAGHIEGVMALEPAARIAVARDLATRVAVHYRTMQSELSEATSTSGDAPTARLQTRNQALQQTMTTVGDVLDSVVQNYDSEQNQAVAQIQRLLEDNVVTQIFNQIGNLDGALGSGQWKDAEMETAVVADHVDHLAQRLDTIHRSLVAPRIEQLRGFEARAVALADGLETLANDGEVTRWHQKADQLLADLATADVHLPSAEELQGAMQSAGWNESASARWDWPTGDNDLLAPPDDHESAIQAVVTEIRRYIQELIIGGIYSADADAVPPEYAEFVRRYFEVLSRDRQDDAPR